MYVVIAPHTKAQKCSPEDVFELLLTMDLPPNHFDKNALPRTSLAMYVRALLTYISTYIHNTISLWLDFHIAT